MSDFAFIGSVSSAQSSGTESASDYSDLRSSDVSSSSSNETPDNDTIELSTASRYLRTLRALPAVRAELVSSVRSEIIAGTYVTDDKIDAALDEMLNELDHEINLG